MGQRRRGQLALAWLRTRRGAAATVAGAGLVAGLIATAGPTAQARQGQAAPAIALAAARAPQPSRAATVRPQLRRGRFLGIIPVRNRRLAITPATANGSPPLTYHLGPVQHSSAIYMIFWQPPNYLMRASFRSAIARYFTDVAASSFSTTNVYASDTQYYDTLSGSKNWVSYNVTVGGSVLATNPLPPNGCPNYRMGDGVMSRNCLTDAQLKTEIKNVIKAQHWHTGLRREFFLFTPKHLADCFDSRLADGCDDPSAGTSTSYCAYHSWYGSTTLYAVQPWEDETGGCVFSAPNSPEPNGNSADVELYTVSHEQNETMTDPTGQGWFDKSGAENGDECIWLPLPTSFNGTGDYSQTINGDQYLLQFEWSNRAKTCVGGNTYPQPTGSFQAVPSGAGGESFTASASDTDDTAFSYRWQFGDGASSGPSTSPVAAHTYASPGTYTVTLVIFDAHGDQVRVTNSVVVS